MQEDSLYQKGLFLIFLLIISYMVYISAQCKVKGD